MMPVDSKPIVLLEKENKYAQNDPVTALHKIIRICRCQREEVYTAAEHQKPFKSLEHTFLPDLIHGHCLSLSALPQPY